MSPEERRAMEERLGANESFSLGGTRTALPQFPLRGLFDGLGVLEDEG